ncbi:MAG: class I SAM-dependent methyltransferase [Planctomycetes bacterium]|nr:class I SAM-dependent methyltransferase [Planctomycetota bacterium]
MLRSVKGLVRSIPVLRDLARRWARRRAGPAEPFRGSERYWEERYARGDDSGVGSYGKFARFKADTINAFVEAEGIRSVLELGCGDGSQLKLARYPSYLGFDVSATAIEACRRIFAGDPAKSFFLMGDYRGQQADLALSLDVIYHLVEDEVFESYMRTLFGAALRHVIVYASDFDDPGRKDGAHVRHRKFTEWVAKNIPDWTLARHLPNAHPYAGDYRTGSFADFHFYRKR